MADYYRSWGFRSNPFVQTPLPATEEGSRLLIGRDVELSRISTRLSSPPKITTVEGRNGIGKTSLINVAAYRCLEEHFADPSTSLLIPCNTTFQLDASTNADTFVRRAFIQVALTLIKWAEELNRSGRAFDNHQALQRWLTSPMHKSVSGSLQAFGFGVGFGGGQGAANTSRGFDEAGLEDLVRAWLTEIFPNAEGGGVVCTIDNLELLRTSQDARDLVEALRDRILTVQGLRWILCGSTGIVRGLASTPRMNGLLHEPIEVEDIDESLAAAILESRAQSFAVNEQSKLPIHPEDFHTLHRVVHGNIRDTLSAADDFCIWVYEQRGWEVQSAFAREEFVDWLRVSCLSRKEAAEKIIARRPWDLFDRLVNVGGACSPGEYEEFGFDTPQAMRANVLKLEEAGLIQSIRDIDDNRRRTIVVTSSGWMVHFARTNGLDTLYVSDAG